MGAGDQQLGCQEKPTAGFRPHHPQAALAQVGHLEGQLYRDIAATAISVRDIVHELLLLIEPPPKRHSRNVRPDGQDAYGNPLNHSFLIRQNQVACLLFSSPTIESI